MVVYEIDATVEAAICDAFEDYMRNTHLPDVVVTGYFESGEMEQIGDGKFRMRYFVQDKAKLDEYLAKDAEALRRDFAAHFPRGVKIERKVYEI